jgi:hypothetical protein
MRMPKNVVAQLPHDTTTAVTTATGTASTTVCTLLFTHSYI